jgi:chemotaxis protein histidine kinase CheA
MNQIHMWQMGVDVCLVLAILVMTFRWMKGSQAQALLPRTMELESSLRSLIHEADAAGRHLNEQLLRREQNLQKFIGDIDEAEQRLSRAIASSEERSNDLASGSEKAQSILKEITTVLADLRRELKEPAPRKAPAREEAPARPVARAAEPQAPDFDDIAPEYAENPPASRQQARNQQPEAPQRRQAEMPAPARASQQPRRDDRIELEAQQAQARPTRAPQQQPMQRQAVAEDRAQRAEPQPRRQAAYEPERASQRELQQVYATAEELLKQGKKLEQVSAQARIPVEEVRLLSQMIEIEREEAGRASTKRPAQAPPADPRLGALGAIRRQTTSL